MRLIHKIMIPFLIYCSFQASDISARPPKTLDFGFAGYKKTGEMLFREPVRHVLIKDADLRPYAMIFENRISFLGKDGKVISESFLPATERVRTGESAHDKFVAVCGGLIDSRQGFFRLFDDEGKLLLSRDSIPYNDRAPVPLPLDSSRRLVSVRDGALIVTNFDGDTIATKALLSKDSSQDGDIVLALRGNHDEFAAIANKYLIPTYKEGDGPTLHYFDANLDSLYQSELPYILVSGIAYTPDGKYLEIRAELNDGKNQRIIKRVEPSPIDQPLELEDVQFLRIAVRSKDRPYELDSGRPAAQSDMALVVPSRGLPALFSAPEWNCLDSISLPTPWLSWVDVALGPDGGFALFYNDDELVLWKAQNGQLGRTPFPYSFRRCFISKGGKRIVLAGDFGFVVYESER